MRLDAAGPYIVGTIVDLVRNLTRAGPAGMRRAKLDGCHIGRRALELDEIAIRNQRADGRTRSPKVLCAVSDSVQLARLVWRKIRRSGDSGQ